jgi:hypothetical protein
MTTQGDFDEEDSSRRHYATPYNSNHPVPTIQKYREHRDELGNPQKQEEGTYNSDEEGKLQHAVGSVKKIFVGQDNKHASGDPYPAENRDDAAATEKQEQSSPAPPAAPAKDKHHVPHAPQQQENSGHGDQENERLDEDQEKSQHGAPKKDDHQVSATQINAGITNPKQKRKNMNRMKKDNGGREVTDPITHLPVII